MLVILPWEIFTIPGDEGIVYVHDVQRPCADWKIEGDFETGSVYQPQSYNNIEKIIHDYKIDVEHVYMDHYLHWTDFPYPYTGIPHCFLHNCNQFSTGAIPGEYSDKQCCFIMMNMRRDNRLLVSAWFSQNKDIDFDYSQGWKVENNDFLVTKECAHLTPYKLDSFLDKKFTTYKNNGSSNETFNRHVNHDHGSEHWPSGNYHGGEGNVAIWNNVLKEQFCSSTFSVITEPPFWENGCVITEKYLMALYGCCFPIFCGGGYGLVDQLIGLGFDVFDDVIDHSYQYELHPGERVLHALENNREILKSHSVKKLDYMDRHLNNLTLIKENFRSQFDHVKFEKYFNKVKKYRPRLISYY